MELNKWSIFCCCLFLEHVRNKKNAKKREWESRKDKRESNKTIKRRERNRSRIIIL